MQPYKAEQHMIPLPEVWPIVNHLTVSHDGAEQVMSHHIVTDVADECILPEGLSAKGHP